MNRLAALRRRFAGPVLTLVTGSALAQALVLGARPALTRLYPPEAFGALTVFLAAVALLDTVSSLRYEDAALLPESDRDGATLTVLSLALVSLTVLLLGAIGLVFPAALVRVGAEGLEGAWALVLAGALGAGWIVVLARWHARRHRFGTISASRVAQSMTAVGVQLGAAYLVTRAGAGLVSGAAAGFIAGAVVLAAPAVLRDGALLRTGLRLGDIRRLARRYARFPAFAAPAGLLKTLAGRVAVFLLAALFGAQTVGQFGLAYGTLALPVDLLTRAVGEVFFVRAAAAHREGRLAEVTAETLGRLVKLAAFPVLVVASAGPTLFAFVFGGVWVEAGEFARVLAPWVFLSSVAVPLTGLFDVREAQRADLSVSAVFFVAQAGALWLGGLAGAYEAVTALSVAGVVLRLGHLGYMLHLAGVAVAPALRRAVRGLLGGCVGAAPVLIAEVAGAPAWLVFAIAVACGASYYAVVGLRETRA